MAKFIPLEVDNDIPYKNIFNPLHNITEQQAEQMIDSARSGQISQIQLLYSLVEESSLILNMNIQRRTAALPDWTIRKRNAKKYRKFDETLANEQEEYLLEQFIQAEDSGTLIPALKTLQMAIFRGLGVVQPVYSERGLEKLIPLDNWNFAVDYSRHNELGDYPIYWNPTGQNVISFKEKLEQIPSNQIIANFNNAPIDEYGLIQFLARQLGFESYNKLIARKGLPCSIIIAPEDLPQENLAIWAQKAKEIAMGGNGVLPYGSQVQSMNIDANNGQAIQNFLEYLDKQITLASTGGSITSLTEATGLGSNVATIQMDVFKSIVKNDAYKIGNLINRNIVNFLLDAKFPNKPHLVYFDLEDEQKESPDKYLQDAVLAKNAGMKIDIQQLQEMTGYTLTEENTPPTTSIWNVPNSEKTIIKNDDAPAADASDESDTTDETAQEAVEENISNPTDDNVEEGASLLKGFSKILEPIKKLFAKLVKTEDEKECEQLVKEINAEISNIENSDDNEFIQAVTNLYKKEFEKEI